MRVILPDQKAEEDPLEELRGLATTAQTEVVMGMTQKRNRPDVRTYVGKGKLEELAQLVDAHEADVRHLSITISALRRSATWKKL